MRYVKWGPQMMPGPSRSMVTPARIFRHARYRGYHKALLMHLESLAAMRRASAEMRFAEYTDALQAKLRALYGGEEQR